MHVHGDATPMNPGFLFQVAAIRGPRQVAGRNYDDRIGFSTGAGGSVSGAGRPRERRGVTVINALVGTGTTPRAPCCHCHNAP